MRIRQVSFDLCRWRQRKAGIHGWRGDGRRRHEQSRWRSGKACTRFSDPCIDVPSHGAAQLERVGGYMRMTRHVAGQQDLTARENDILTDTTSFPALEAIASRDDVSTDVGPLVEEQDGTRHADRAGHRAIDHDALPGRQHIAIHFAVNRDRLAQGDQVAVHGAVKNEGRGRDVKVIVDHFIARDHNVFPRAAVECPCRSGEGQC